jgi:signal transduction histidine kinase
LELLEDDLDPQRLDLDDARERTLRAREHSRQLSSLASDLLDLSRLDAEVALRTEPVELGELCRAVAAEFELRAAQREIRIDARQPQQPSWASCDPGAVARIVRILLDNAVGVAPAGTSVHTQTATDGSWAQVIVSDAGPGVPEDEREQVFERFQRGSTSGGRSGFGLGLAIGRELASRMGGSLALLDGAADADPPGARFALRLPAARVEADNAA